MTKLEWIYNCCTNDISKEVSAFWFGHDINKDELVIDANNLQGIIIFIVSRILNPQIIAEVHYMQKFLPKAVLKSSRTLYLEMIGAAVNYLLDIDLNKNKNMRKKKKDLPPTVAQNSADLDPCYKPNVAVDKKQNYDSDSGSDSDYMTEDADLRGTIKDDEYTYQQNGVG